MTTVLSVGNSEGERRCDARCHAAKHGECDCVCRGRYHGVGKSQAVQQVGQDVLDGVFGEAVAVEGRRQLEALREGQPETVRFHRREVARALRRAAQPRLMDGRRDA